MSDIKQSLESDAFWVRTLFIILFSIVYRLLDLVVLFLVVVQWGFSLVTGQVNPALNQFSLSLSCYIAQIVRYVTGNSEEKPFPFTDWPTPTKRIANGAVVKVYLIRHGEAVPGSPDDISRSLTERGADNALRAAKWLKHVIKGPAAIWASPFLRTQQTAQPIAEALGLDIINHQCLTPDSAPQKVVDELTTEQQDIILVTHLPLVGRLASLLIEGVIHDQPWSPTEIWQLEGEVFAAACMQNTDVWYPALEGG